MNIFSKKTLTALAVMGMVSFASAQDMESKAFEANFDATRSAGYGYAMRGNPAAAYSIADYLILPNLISGQHFAHIEPGKASVRNGMVSASMGGQTYFGHIGRTADDNGLATIGFAKPEQGFGMVLRLSGDALATSNKGPKVEGAVTTTTTTTTSDFEKGGQIGLGFGSKVGSSTLYGSVDYSTHAKGSSSDNKEETGSGLDLVVGMHAPTESSVSDFGVAFAIKPEEVQTKDAAGAVTTSVLDSSHWKIAFHYNFGKVVASGKDFRVLIGANNAVSYKALADIKSTRKDAAIYGLDVVPNFGLEYALAESFYVFGGFSQLITIGGKTSAVPALVGSVETSTTTFGVKSMNSQADIGFRYQVGRFAFETVLHEDIWDGGLGQIFSNGSNFMTQSSLTVNF